MNVPYVVSFDNPPPSIPEMAYWERVTIEQDTGLAGHDIMSVALQIANNTLAKEPAMSLGGWRLRWLNGEYTDAIPDGEEFNVNASYDFIRKTLPSGELVAIPAPRPSICGIGGKPTGALMGELVQLEPNLDVLLANSKRGDALYVLVPSKVWPDFEEHPLSRAIYDVCAGIDDEDEEPHTWAELRDAPSPKVLGSNLWIIRREFDESVETYRTCIDNPPPPNQKVAYWERGVESEGSRTTPGWRAICIKGDELFWVPDGTVYTVEKPRAVYEFHEETDGVYLAIAEPRHATDCKEAGTLLGNLLMLRPSMAKFCHWCHDDRTRFIMVGKELWRKLLNNKKVMHDFEPAPCKDQVLNGLMGTYKGVPVWSDMFNLPGEKSFGCKLWVCREAAK